MTDIYAMNDGQIGEASEMLLALRRGERSLEGLPDRLVPRSTADIQKIIDRTHALVARPVRGWKIYSVYKPMQPIFYAPIYDLFRSDETIPAELSPLRLIEPEIMFRLDTNLPRSDSRTSHAELSRQVTAVVGMEAVGGRFRNQSVDHVYDVSKALKPNLGHLADHIANDCIVVGDQIENWREVAFEQVPVRMTQGGRPIVDHVGGHPFDDPFLPVLVGVNRIRRQQGLRAGDVIVTSSSTSFFPVDAEVIIEATYSGLGSVRTIFGAPAG